MTGIVWQGPTRGLRVDVRPGDQPVVEVGGEIDLYSSAELRDELLRVLRRCGPQLILDLREVTFMDAAGIEVLLATRRRAQLEGGWVRLVRASPCAWRMITVAGLQREFAPPKDS